jgi:putative flavoprotein involved in K+ transport
MTAEVLGAVVIGAGAAGLAAAYHLQRQGRRFVVLEASPVPSGSWPQYYDSLTLFTPARHSGLPGLPFPGSAGHYPSRDEMAEYLQSYAEHHAFPVQTGTRVLRVRKAEVGFEVQTENGGVLSARTVICASGTFGRPFSPALPGEAEYQGKRLHSSVYRNAEPFAGQRVVVVGAGNSAAQIAAELSRMARVSLAVRSRPHLIAQRPLGVDLTDWLSLSGIERVPFGRLFRVPDVQPVIAVPGVKAAFRRRTFDMRPMFTAFTPAGVRWADGREEDVDSVVFATGYRSDSPYLPADALDAEGEPRQRGGLSRVYPGLAFVGLPGQRTVASGTIRAAGSDAGAVVRRLTSG